MKPNKGITIMSASSSYNDEVVKSINDAQAWVRNWYNKRAKLINPYTGEPYLTKAQLKEINYRLDHLRIYIGNDSSRIWLNDLRRKSDLSRLEKALVNALKSATHEEQVEVIQDMIDGDSERIGACYVASKEKNVTLNLDAWREDTMNHQNSYMQQIPGDLTRIAIHEITHASTHDLHLEEDVVYMFHPDRELHSYYDEKSEVYARLNEVRYSLGLEPDQKLTSDQVNQFREEMRKVDAENKAKIDERLRTDGREKFEVPQLDKRYDARFLERYHTKEAVDMLNDLVEARPLERLNMEHGDAKEGSYRPEVAWRRENIPVQTTETISLHRGFHV